MEEKRNAMIKPLTIPFSFNCREAENAPRKTAMQLTIVVKTGIMLFGKVSILLSMKAMMANSPAAITAVNIVEIMIALALFPIKRPLLIPVQLFC